MTARGSAGGLVNPARHGSAGAWGAVGLWMAVTWALSDQPKLSPWPWLQLPLPIPHLDKLVHAGWYGVLGTLVTVAARAQGIAPRRGILLAIGIGAAHGLLDEWHQSFVPGRAVELADWVADVVGASLAASLATRLAPPQALASRAATQE